MHGISPLIRELRDNGNDAYAGRRRRGGSRERSLPREVLRLHQMTASGGSIEWAQRTATAFGEAAAREFDSSAFEGVPASPDLEWLRAGVDYLVRRDP
jgi:hypothetical protein